MRTRRQGFSPGPSLGRAIPQQLSGSAQTCDAPDCANPRGAFTSERDGPIYEFSSERYKTKFESEPA